jgi:hypothetical protein
MSKLLHYSIFCVALCIGFLCAPTVTATSNNLIEQLFINKGTIIENFKECKTNASGQTFCPVLINPDTKQPVTDDIFSCGCPAANENGDILGDCVYTVEEWKASPIKRSVYIPDPSATITMQSNIRAQQLLGWAFDLNNPLSFFGITNKWRESQNIALLIIINVIGITALIIIVSQLFNSNKKLDITTRLTRIVLSIFFTLFSFAAVSGMTQLSDLVSRVLRADATVESLTRITKFDSKKTSDQTNNPEINYQNIVCQNLNIGTLEQAESIKNQTNLATISYNVIAYLIIIKILLSWFLAIVAPVVLVFYAFNFGKQIIEGWLYMCVLVWLYGPLQSFFLHIVHSLWNSGIPFAFYSSTNTLTATFPPAFIEGYISGPSQVDKLSYINNVSNISTYAEFAVSICMLWIAILLPFVLLFFVRKLFKDSSDAMQSQLFSIYEKLGSTNYSNLVSKISGGSNSKSGSNINTNSTVSNGSITANNVANNFIKNNTFDSTESSSSAFTQRVNSESSNKQTTVSSPVMGIVNNASSATNILQNTNGIATQFTVSDVSNQNNVLSSASATNKDSATQQFTTSTAAYLAHTMPSVNPVAPQQLVDALVTISDKPENVVRDIANSVYNHMQTKNTDNITEVLSKNYSSLSNTTLQEIIDSTSSYYASTQNVINTTNSTTSNINPGVSMMDIARHLSNKPQEVNSSSIHVQLNNPMMIAKTIDVSKASKEDVKKTKNEVAKHPELAKDKQIEVTASATGIEKSITEKIIGALYGAFTALFKGEDILIEDSIAFKTIEKTKLQDFYIAWQKHYEQVFATTKAEDKVDIMRSELLQNVYIIHKLISGTTQDISEGVTMASTLLGADIVGQVSGEELCAIMYSRIKVLRDLIKKV